MEKTDTSLFLDVLRDIARATTLEELATAQITARRAEVSACDADRELVWTVILAWLEKQTEALTPPADDCTCLECGGAMDPRQVAADPDVDFCAGCVAKMQAADEDDDGFDETWRREIAMEEGMLGGCDAYNEVMGYD